MKTKRLDEVDIAHISLEIALFLNAEVINSQGWFNHPQPSVAWVPTLLLFCCLQTCLVNWWQLLWYMYIYTCECMWIGCDNCYDICIWMFDGCMCCVAEYNLEYMNCFFCFRMCNAKISKKGTLTNISVAVTFSELPRIIHIRGGYISVAATDNYISVAVTTIQATDMCYSW